MALFKLAENLMAYAKVGLLGFSGSGKTRTAWEIAKGLHIALASEKPIGFLDTETGSDFILPLANQAGIQLLVSRSRAFEKLVEGIEEAQKLVDILIIDSVSHYWNDLMESYKRKNDKKYIVFQDWGVLKPTWHRFSSWYVNSHMHVIVCGRAGFEYDYFQSESGAMELYKTGVKMKAEAEFGFEPSLLIEMERIKNPELSDEYKEAKTKDARIRAASKLMQERMWVRRATVMKDRADILDGQFFDNPTFQDFAPHWKALNIGGIHAPIEEGDSQALFDSDGRPEWKKRDTLKRVALENIQGALVALWPGTTSEAKGIKAYMLKMIFDTRSWTDIENRKLEDLQPAAQRLEIFVDLFPQYQNDMPDERMEMIALACWQEILKQDIATPKRGENGFSLSDLAAMEARLEQECAAAYANHGTPAFLPQARKVWWLKFRNPIDSKGFARELPELTVAHLGQWWQTRTETEQQQIIEALDNV